MMLHEILEGSHLGRILYRSNTMWLCRREGQPGGYLQTNHQLSDMLYLAATWQLVEYSYASECAGSRGTVVEFALVVGVGLVVLFWLKD